MDPFFLFVIGLSLYLLKNLPAFVCGLFRLLPVSGDIYPFQQLLLDVIIVTDPAGQGDLAAA